MMQGEDSALKTSSASTMPHFVSGRLALAQIMSSLISLNYRQTRKATKGYHIGEKLEHDCKPQTLYK